MSSPSLIDPFGPDAGGVWLKGNLHAHTTESDGHVEPGPRVAQYRERGYDFLCLSDHHRITRVSGVPVPEGMTLIQGAEIHPDNPFGGQGYHLLAYNMTDDVDAQRMPPQHVIDAVREQGGSVWLAHPHWSGINVRRDVTPLTGLAGIEVFNTICQRMGRGEAGIDLGRLDGPRRPPAAGDRQRRLPRQPRARRRPVPGLVDGARGRPLAAGDRGRARTGRVVLHDRAGDPLATGHAAREAGLG